MNEFGIPVCGLDEIDPAWLTVAPSGRVIMKSFAEAFNIVRTPMKRELFDITKYDPKRTLMCGDDVVTEFAVGDFCVAGVVVQKDGKRSIFMWGLAGTPLQWSNQPLEVLIPEPEKPREFTRGDARSMMRKHRKNQDGSWAALDEAWVDSIMDGYLLGFAHGREVLIPEPEKLREWWQVVEVATDAAMSPRFDTKPEAEKYLDDLGRRPSLRVAHYHEVTEPAPTPERDGECQRCDGTGCPVCDARWAEHQVRASPEAEAAVDAALRHSTQPQGWVSLHNGVPQWRNAAPTIGEATKHASLYAGHVVPCIVKPKPMTREEARWLVVKHLGPANRKMRGDEWAINAILEAANGRAEGV